MLRLLINAGPTREYFDSVRFISNASTGKQGYAIAEAAGRRGHRVTLVSGPVGLPPPPGVEVLPVTSAAEMAAACKSRFDESDAAILTAAVCDYRPSQRDTYKTPKLGTPLQITLEPTEDIAAALGRIKGRRIVVAFAMNDVDAQHHAERKLREKHCDVMVSNGPENVGADVVTVQFLLRDGGWQPSISGTKRDVAGRIIDVVEALRGGRGP